MRRKEKFYYSNKREREQKQEDEGEIRKLKCFSAAFE
jgi:hypothetical protein